MNTVILTSVFSAGNHALFAGTRVLYGLSVVSPHRQAPAIFSKTTSTGVPIFALLATSSISILCFASSFIGSGQLWGWLQNIVGVSNQVSVTLLCSILFVLSPSRLHGYPLASPAGDSEGLGLPRIALWTNSSSTFAGLGLGVLISSYVTSHSTYGACSLRCRPFPWQH